MKSKKERNAESEKKKYRWNHFLYDLAFAFVLVTAFIWYRPKKYYISERAKKKIHGGALLISNHIGFCDPVYLVLAVGYRRQRFIATKELFSTRFKRFLFGTVAHCIRIDRENVSSATVHEIVGILKGDGVVTMFPEGHINVTDKEEMQAFKSGAVLMALKSGKPVIPVYVHNRKNIFKRLVIVIGEPITISLDGSVSPLEYIDTMTKTIFEKENELKEFYRGHHN